MATVAVVCQEHPDEQWVFGATDGALVFVDTMPADVVVVTADCLDAVVELMPQDQVLVVVGDPTIAYPRADYIVSRAWPADHLRRLLVALATKRPLPIEPPPPPENPAEARDAQRAIAGARKLGTVTDLVAAEATAIEVVIELLEADRAYCLFYDAASAQIWSEAKHRAGEDERKAFAGLAGYAARTGTPAVAVRAGDDPRFFGAIDDAHGDTSDHVVAQPVHGSDGEVHAVLVAVRRGRRPAFADHELRLLARFSQVATPVLDQLSIHLQSQAILDENEPGGGLFRSEAIAAQAMPRWGDVVRIAPGWLSWAYWMLVVLLVGAGAFVVLGTVATYSLGPAVVRSTARTPITARSGGNITSVNVAPGDRVEAGATIAQLDDSEQRAAADRLQLEFETQLRNHLLNLNDATAEGSLRSIRHDLDAARTTRDERQVRAPVAGVVGDVRVRASQHIEPGDVVAVVVDAKETLEVIALLPGEDRPQLAPGMVLRLELAGYRYVYQSLVIDSVSSDVIAPSEARRVLGTDVADNLALTGPVVLVRGRLPAAQFTVDDRVFRYHDGMLGAAEVRVRSEPIIFTLVPGTRRLAR
jgi:multidrug efflux pump subunit AcrA (membrane-fusion protein)